MKPNTKAKTINQFVNQIEALDEIIDAAIDGAINLGLSNKRRDNHEPGDPFLHQALMEAKRAIFIARDIAVGENTKVVRAKQKDRNEKYEYLRKEYYAKKTDNTFSAQKALESAAAGRERLKVWQEEQRKFKEQVAADNHTVAVLKGEA